MKFSPLINKYGGIDHLDINIEVEYIDNRWIFYVNVPTTKIKFCIKQEDLESGIRSLVQSSLEHMHWHLEEMNKNEA